MKSLRTSPSKTHLALVLSLLAVFLTLNLLSLRHLAPTTDEEKHFLYGQMILELDSTRFDDSKMPFSALNALPQKLSGLFPAGAIRTLLQELATARLMTILFSTGVALLVYRWTREIYGLHAGIVALFLYTWDPNLIAHSMLVTTDLYSVGMALFSLYFFWKFLHKPDWKSGFLSATVLGLSQLAKYTSVFLYPLFLLIALIFYAPQALSLWWEKAYRPILQFLSRFIGVAALFLLVSLLIINLGFLFNRTFTPLPDYSFDSNLFQTIQQKLSPLGNLPVPVPYPYLQGLDMVRDREQTGFGFGRIYLLGQLRESEGFKGYYFFATLLKMPLAVQGILLYALISYVRGFRWSTFRHTDQFFVLPALFFTLYFNFFYNAQIGIRYFLLVYPLLYLLAGRLLEHWPQITRPQKVLGGILAAYTVISVLSYHPHYIPYFNELVWDRRFAYCYLADSNLDWDQADFYLEDYLALHPNARVEPLRPRDGLTIVSVNALVGVTGSRDQFAWLRDNFVPTETIAYAYLVYDISTQEFKKVFP